MAEGNRRREGTTEKIKESVCAIDVTICKRQLVSDAVSHG
jgi:hypothetical protein